MVAICVKKKKNKIIIIVMIFPIIPLVRDHLSD